jgi:hypothetical protein
VLAEILAILFVLLFLAHRWVATERNLGVTAQKFGLLLRQPSLLSGGKLGWLLRHLVPPRRAYCFRSHRCVVSIPNAIGEQTNRNAGQRSMSQPARWRSPMGAPQSGHWFELLAHAFSQRANGTTFVSGVRLMIFSISSATR